MKGECDFCHKDAIAQYASLSRPNIYDVCGDHTQKLLESGHDFMRVKAYVKKEEESEE